MPKAMYLTPEGRKNLESKIATALEQLKGIRAEKSRAFELSGDGWHDNPYLNKLTQDEQAKAAEVAALQALLTEAQVFICKSRNTEKVQLGSIVKFSRESDKDPRSEVVYEIVGYNETDLTQKKIGYNSPLGRALLGMSVGDTKKITLPAGVTELEVIELYPDWETP